MDFYKELEASKAFVVESQGNTILGSDKKGFAVAQRDGNSGYKYIKGKDGANIKVKSAAFTISSAERVDSKNLLGIKEKNGDITTWQMDKNWQFKKDLGSSSPETLEYIEDEFKFSQSFEQASGNNRGDKLEQSNFWVSEPEAFRLWGFLNYGQYKNSTQGADARVFETFSRWAYPVSGIPNETKNKHVVAVVDTGVNYNHEELNENMYVNKREMHGNGIDDDKNGYVDDVIGFDFTENEPLQWDDHGHGTHVAGTIGAAVNNRGVIGANPNAKILGVKVLGPKGGTTSDVIEGYNYALSRGAKVINLSLGGGSYSPAFEKAIDIGGSKYKAITVAAAGNDASNNDEKPKYPASYESETLVSVASSDFNDLHSEFSNWGKNSVDLHAPGEAIYSPYVGGESSYMYSKGTSMATPLVSGIISSYWSRNPKQSPAAVIDRLLKTVDDIGYSGYTKTGGRVNMERFMGYTGQLESAQDKIEEKEISFLAPELSQGQAADALDNIIAHTKKDLKKLDLTDSVILDFKGSSGLSKRNVSKVRKRLSSSLGREWTGDLNILEVFDGDLATLDFGDRIALRKKEKFLNWLFKNDFIDSVEVDSVYYAI